MKKFLAVILCMTMVPCMGRGVHGGGHHSATSHPSTHTGHHTLVFPFQHSAASHTVAAPDGTAVHRATLGDPGVRVGESGSTTYSAAIASWFNHPAHSTPDSVYYKDPYSTGTVRTYATQPLTSDKDFWNFTMVWAIVVTLGFSVGAVFWYRNKRKEEACEEATTQPVLGDKSGQYLGEEAA